MSVESCVDGMIRAARVVVTDPARRERLERAIDAYDGPLRLAVLGAPRSGATTLCHALDDPDGTGALGGVRVLDCSSDGDATLVRDADAVLYVAHHARADDVARLAERTAPGPLRGLAVLVVLSRADEIGGGRPDALVGATLVARRLAATEQLAALSCDVLPIAGLVACHARGLDAARFAELRAVARLSPAERERQLLSADRFAAAGGSARRDLLAELGLFGTRLAVSLLAADRRLTRAGLVAELERRSGLPRLRAVLAERFVLRAAALKRMTLQRELDALLDAEERERAHLDVLEEELDGAAQDVREMRALVAVTRGVPGLPHALASEAARLLGRDGVDPRSRLGLAAGDGPEAVRRAAAAALERWRDFAEAPDRDEDVARVARIVVRCCEGMLDDFAPVSALAIVRSLSSASARHERRDRDRDRRRRSQADVRRERDEHEPVVLALRREHRGRERRDDDMHREERSDERRPPASRPDEPAADERLDDRHRRERDERRHERRDREAVRRLLVSGSQLLDGLAQRFEPVGAREVGREEDGRRDDDARAEQHARDAGPRQAPTRDEER